MFLGYRTQGRDACAGYTPPAQGSLSSMPYTFLFCLRGVYFLGAIYMALHSLASFEMPQVVARYTELLDVPAVTWKLQLGKSGDGKNWKEPCHEFHQGSLEGSPHPAAAALWFCAQTDQSLPRWNLRWWRQAVALCAIKNGFAWEWRHAVLRECKIFMSSASSTSRAFPATTLGKLWGRDDYSHDMQDYYTRVYSPKAAAGDIHGRPFGRQTQVLLPRPGATTTRAAAEDSQAKGVPTGSEATVFNEKHMLKNRVWNMAPGSILSISLPWQHNFWARCFWTRARSAYPPYLVNVLWIHVDSASPKIATLPLGPSL